MNPTPSDLHVNVPLTSLSIAYMQSADQFVADQVFPVVPVSKQSDSYWEYDRKDFFRASMAKRAPATESAGGAFRVSTDTYYAHVFARHYNIDDQTRRNADSIFNLDADATRLLSMQAMLHREKDWADNFFTTGVWTTDITGVTGSPSASQALKWSDAASTPIENISDATLSIQEKTGFRPNTLVMGARVWKKLMNHPDIIDRMKGGATPDNPAILQRRQFAALVEVDRVLVMGGVENTAAEGLTGSYSFIGGSHALLCYAAPSPGLMSASAGMTFAWRGYLGGSSPVAISRFRLDQIKSDRIEIEAAYVQKKTGADLGYFWNSII